MFEWIPFWIPINFRERRQIIANCNQFKQFHWSIIMSSVMWLDTSKFHHVSSGRGDPSVSVRPNKPTWHRCVTEPIGTTSNSKLSTIPYQWGFHAYYLRADLDTEEIYPKIVGDIETILGRIRFIKKDVWGLLSLRLLVCQILTQFTRGLTKSHQGVTLLHSFL